MATTENGLIRLAWSDVREDVAKIEPKFARIVDDISPDDTFSVYKAYYEYGELIADPVQMYLPVKSGGVSSLDPAIFDSQVTHDLSYGKNSWAMGMVLNKNIEVFIDIKDVCTSIPWMIYKPGTIFPYAKLLSKNKSRTYAPNNILTVSSGTRSTFMLPNIGCHTHHMNLRKDYHVQSPAPKSLYEHSQVFKEIISSNMSRSKWYSCLLYFSEKWVNHIQKDDAWVPLKMYLHELAWSHFDYRRNHIYYEIAFSRIQKKRNLKPNPYLSDTASHLFKMALGDAPGFAPACDNESLPLDVLQNAYDESYGMKKYLPTIMQPEYFSLEEENSRPIYYSLQNPSTFVSSPKSRRASNTLFDMHELEHLMKVSQEELSKENSICYGTVISDITQNINFKYYHSEIDPHGVILNSAKIEHDDERFSRLYSNSEVGNAVFASEAKFLRGCVSIYSKNSSQSFEKVE